MNAQDVTKHRRWLKISLVYAFNNKCYICSGKFNPQMYEFHHIIPKNKKFGLSDNNTRSMAAVCKEATKCIMLCPNCHRKITLNLVKIKHVKSNFDKSLFYKKHHQILLHNKLERNKRNKTKKKKIYTCVICNTPVSRHSKFCEKHKNKYYHGNDGNLHKRPNLKEIRHDLVKFKSFTNLGKKYFVDPTTVRLWCKSNGHFLTIKDLKQLGKQ